MKRSKYPRQDDWIEYPTKKEDWEVELNPSGCFELLLFFILYATFMVILSGIVCYMR